MKHQLRIIPLAVALALPQLAFAAEDKATTLPEVTVSASKDAVGATQVDEASLAGMRAATSDSASLLRDVPGVSLYGAGGVSSLPVIHGLADDRLRIKVDGMDLISACGNHMNPPLVLHRSIQCGQHPGVCRHCAGERGRRQHRWRHPGEIARAGICSSRAGDFAQGSGRRFLSQQRQCHGRQSFGNRRERKAEPDV